MANQNILKPKPTNVEGNQIFSLLFLGFILVSSAMAFLLSSCNQTDLPPIIIPEPTQQLIEINTDNLATHYYNLGLRKIVSSNKITDWDLKLCSQSDKYYFYLNTAKNMKIAKYDGNFSDVINPAMALGWKADMVKNGKETTAMGSWGDFSFTNPKSFGFTYIVDLGYLNVVNEFGYRKIQILGCANNIYTIRYAQLDDPEGDTIKIEKKSDYNNLFFSFKNGGKVVQIEPRHTEWDLVFTQYGLSQPVMKDSVAIDTTHTWTDFVLLNNYGRQIACDTQKSFDDITFWDAENYSYSSASDFIGNRWRHLISTPNVYGVTKRNVYILKNTHNHIYNIEFKSVDKTNSRITKLELRIKNL